VSTAVPTICHGCGSALSGTVFCEDGQSYHFGCRPSQRADTTFRSQREHNDLLGRIAGLEAELRKWKADFRAMETVALDHEAELAERDKQPCATCAKWREETALGSDYRLCTTWDASTTASVFCSFWIDRVEEGSE
jgi:hypothetical protein